MSKIELKVDIPDMSPERKFLDELRDLLEKHDVCIWQALFDGNVGEQVIIQSTKFTHNFKIPGNGFDSNVLKQVGDDLDRFLIKIEE